MRIVAVVGPNASGKSELGIHLGERFDGEVVSADSRQVYRGLDIGAGKVPPADRRGVPHHLIDVRSPPEWFSLAHFQRLAYDAVDSANARRHLPILVGGTPLYVRAVIDGYCLVDVPPDAAARRRREAAPIEQLVEELEQLWPAPPRSLDLRNKRRVIRALEIASAGHGPWAMARRQPRYESLQLGLTWPDDELRRRIADRLRTRLAAGMVQEVEDLLARGVPREFLFALGLEYRHVLMLLEGRYADLEELEAGLARAIFRFSRRQLAWFGKDPRVRWLDTTGDHRRQAEAEVARFLGGTGSVPPVRERTSGA